MPIAVDHCRAPHQANTQFGESLFRAAARAAARAATLLEDLAAAPADQPRFRMVRTADGGGNQTLAHCLAGFIPEDSIKRRLQATHDASSDDAVIRELEGVIGNIGSYVPLDKKSFPSVRWLASTLGKPLFVLGLVRDASLWSSVSQQQRCTVVNADSAGGAGGSCEAEAYVACKSPGGANIDDAICILHAGNQYRLLESLGWSTERIETFINMANASIFKLNPNGQIDRLRPYLLPGGVVADATATVAFNFIQRCVDKIKPKIHFQWEGSVKQGAWKDSESYKTPEKRSIIVSIFDDVFAALQGMWTKTKIDDFIALCNANRKTVNDDEVEGYIRNFLTGSKEINGPIARGAAAIIDALLRKRLRELNIKYGEFTREDCMAVQDFVPEKTRVCFEAWYQEIKDAAAAQAQAPAQLPGTAAAGAGVRAAVLIRRAAAAAADVAGARATVAVADLTRRAAAAAAAAVVAGATDRQQVSLVANYKSEDEESDENADNEAILVSEKHHLNITSARFLVHPRALAWCRTPSVVSN